MVHEVYKNKERAKNCQFWSKDELIYINEWANSMSETKGKDLKNFMRDFSIKRPFAKEKILTTKNETQNLKFKHSLMLQDKRNVVFIPYVKFMRIGDDTCFFKLGYCEYTLALKIYNFIYRR